VQFPILRRLAVHGYDLYPGTSEKPDLDATFLPGVTLIVGANGLGKSTLILVLYRLLTGPSEVAGDTGTSVLGSGQLTLRPFRDQEPRMFARRVADQAVDALAEVEFSLGDRYVQVSRKLSTLQLSTLTVDGKAVDVSEAAFQALIVEAAGVGHFVDWLLILRYITFFFEDRRSLVWDPTAQRRILKLLFTPPTQEDRIGEFEKRILSTDSRARNTRATLAAEERKLEQQEKALSTLPVQQAELEELLATREDSERESEELRERSAALDAVRADVRLTLLRAREHRTSLANELESIRFQQIRDAFPTSSETAAYLLTQILAEDKCSACGTQVPDFRAALEERLAVGDCVVCGSHISEPGDGAGATSADLAELQERLEVAEGAEREATANRDVTEAELRQCWGRLAELDQVVRAAETRIRRLELNMPQASRSQARREAIRDLRRQNEEEIAGVLRDKDELDRLVQAVNLQIAEYQGRVRAAFDGYAEDFLLDTCSLVWGSNVEQVGLLGKGISFSVFQIDMSGATTDAEVTRRASDGVSESQREFIDLAFRMALIQVAGTEGVGSLIMDAPESSLDAVFAPRAASVLTGFATPGSESRVIITSNLVDGRLIPTIAEQANIDGPDDPRVVNLFEIATPTRALDQLRDLYMEALRRAFSPEERPSAQ
jgi:energy-coupling factor transporter ATP-binding protein EcfA2